MKCNEGEQDLDHEHLQYAVHKRVSYCVLISYLYLNFEIIRSESISKPVMVRVLLSVGPLTSLLELS